MTPNSTQPEKSHKKLWITIAVIVAACAIIGIIIWKMIDVNPHVV